MCSKWQLHPRASTTSVKCEKQSKWHKHSSAKYYLTIWLCNSNMSGSPETNTATVQVVFSTTISMWNKYTNKQECKYIYISTTVFALDCPGLYSSTHMIWKSCCLDICLFSRLFPVTFERAVTLGNILTFTFVVWIVNRFEQIPLQNSRKALKANEHSLGDINRVNIATSETASCC